MPAIVLVGAQWGDEGKGKATDLLGDRIDYVVKFNGGNNAGHTVVIGDEKYALHLLPSGILTPGVTPIIGNGVVVDLGVLFSELDALQARGVDTSLLKVSANAHIIPSYNTVLDRVTERFLGSRKIGTTGRGIGPTYADKMSRVGIRVQDLYDESILRQKVGAALAFKNQVLAKIYNRRAVDADRVVAELLSYADRLAPMVTDTSLEIAKALDAGKTVLCEAGQATLLDVDHGTYPYVTSSNATAGGACTGAGLPPTRVDRVIAVLKAFTTRVGEGPFPTELHDEVGTRLREIGHEFGTTTGRPRRVGWLDVVIGRYATRINGTTDVVMTKLDNLDTFEQIPVCVAYDVGGVRVEEMPTNQSDFHHATPIYEYLPGWMEDISGCRTFDELPARCQDYVLFVEQQIGARISAIGVGPGRDEIIQRYALTGGVSVTQAQQESVEPARPAGEDWVTRLADEVVEEATRRQGGELTRRIVCASGLSPSGPIHLGNLREVMVPHFVADEIARRGIAVEHLISWDDYDRFRKVPAAVDGVDESWNAHIGKPLTSVPAPRGSAYANWAEHFKAPMKAALQMLGVSYRPISQTEQYTSGAYREQVLHAMRERARIDEVLGRYRTKAPATAAPAKGKPLDAQSEEAAALAAQGSGAAAEDDGGGTGGYFPFKPYSRAFGTDSTRVVDYDEATTELTYVATGPDGEQVTETMRLDTDTHGKLVWKVDWPMRWAFEGVDFEPSGVDHQSPGSSFVVGGQLVEEVFGGRQPIGPMYAFVGIAGMAKMSSSKGGVPTPADALVLLEAPLLRWLYVRRRPNQSFTVSFDSELLRLYDEWDALCRKVTGGGPAQAGDLAAYARSVRTAERELTLTPKPVPYRALTSIIDITGGHPEQTLRILEGFDLDGPVRSLDDVRPRLDCATEWVHTQLTPAERTHVRPDPDAQLLAGLDDPSREALALLAQRLEDDWSLDGLTTLVYGIPKEQAGLDIGEKKLPAPVKAAQRDLFTLLYRLLIDSDTGPRLPTLLLCVGPERVRRLIGH